ncbi:Glu/Leu/Phe/Val family dehydrogenase [Novosphingobium album (ex Liu et al. 2023)]|uniref:Glu/Leu/Phe/Val dehydrogenase dimerization domain-containing protein n=1 Tax=Novosphingobium album (ex Liu et al. 2023) TaxID=3031130 RepID=A0ABT5WQM4_9SPHN|nr:Glu/Leu/Phe/Val dehydrogenase dimerization domain-containing protein [Novosphingobium album (ex Liu et al. 2023)]MDE8652061.1 Glu/Leu/Phe/Val dehydrogenase dimerization domain-containing protein [Novosphingobium album (ex Liu et al. 2023)]
MAAFWTESDFDDHELVELVHDRASGLTAIIALHSTHLGPGAGGTRFWHYADPAGAMRDALRLSRGMSYKNAMAGLPMGGGKAVILAGPDKAKTPEMLAAFADAVERLGGRYITAEDVGINEMDMAAVARRTPYVSGLPSTDSAAAGGNPGPFTAKGVFLGIKAAVAHKLGTDSMAGVHVAVQGTGSVGGGAARLLAAEGARLTLADVDAGRAAALAGELGADTVAADVVMDVVCDVFSPNALGAVIDDAGISRLRAPIVAGGANNQLARPEHGPRLAERGILYAPDYVINGGGIIAVALEYFARRDGHHCDIAEVHAKVAEVPLRLKAIWQEADATGRSPDQVADAMAQRLIGR